MSINSALSISINALKVNQAALNVVSNNIANMNTDGYSKQRVNLGTLHLSGNTAISKYQQIASNAGVQMTSISRYQNEYLASYFREQSTSVAYYNTSTDIANRITTALDELSDGGLSTMLDNFYAAVSTVQQNPTDTTSRLNFIQQANNLTIALNTKYNDLTEYRTFLVGDNTQASVDASQTADNVTKINTLLADIADVNKRILSSGTLNSSANNLLDQRDTLLSELSEYMNFDTSIGDNGVVSISVGNIDLIKHTVQNYKLNAKATNYTKNDDKRVEIQLINLETNQVDYQDITEKITGGSLGATLLMGSNQENTLTVQSAIDTMNDLAAGIMEVMNNIQTQGWTYDGNPDAAATKFAMAISTDADGNRILVSPSAKLFKTSDGSTKITAGNITINKDFVSNPDLLAVATVTADAGDFVEAYDAKGNFIGYTLNSDDKYGVGDGSNMIDVLNTREGTASVYLQDLSPEEYLMAQVSKIATQSESLQNQLTSQTQVMNAVESQWESETSVDLNEELTDMVKYQYAFQASSRVFNACSDILNTLVTLGQ